MHEDQLLRAHWLATQNPRSADWRRVKSVKERFHLRTYLDDLELLYAEVTAYATSLREASRAYRDIVTEAQDSFVAYGEDAPRVRRLSRQLRQAGGTAIFAPLLIAARLRFPTDGDAYASLVDLCERYAVRAFLIAERRSNAGATRLFGLANHLYRDGNLPAALDGVTNRVRYFAGDDQLWEDLTSPRRNWYAKAGHKYFLYQYELHLLHGAEPAYGFGYFTKGEFRTSTTEHILPQTATKDCWRRAFRKADRELHTHSLGNLVLTDNNAAFGNNCFERKRDGVMGRYGERTRCYAEGILAQERELAKLHEWTPTQVIQRQERLARWAMERWRIAPVDAAAADEPEALEADELAEADSDAEAGADSKLDSVDEITELGEDRRS